ncbi:hypothetical protein Pmar_PMAR001130 [Perkinsus marinus ATCC 50983]|uniref:Uncharacterized protein n=1 Tax=Perkinsus marinus (strain ATCC 50983 / TXsc) TaxID=423536 RepID=C5KSY2_PERM5|nr:hypothetical protein Pmar_PMAR001130 [Perkinsus marinus ATCC 50983]EER12332.1 hypothetical protein Pmar_PMAR001130 [Perkinsus marinus ATCC 50983]|eukprot:XP_002780537.1 hypothetical protein Pmar_PMAR001130 [Perkinsus marinus ATCC 50983]
MDSREYLAHLRMLQKKLNTFRDQLLRMDLLSITRISGAGFDIEGDSGAPQQTEPSTLQKQAYWEALLQKMSNLITTLKQIQTAMHRDFYLLGVAPGSHIYMSPAAVPEMLKLPGRAEYKAGPTGETTISSNVSKRKAREAERAKSDEEAPEVKRQKMERKIDLYNRAMDKVISNTIDAVEESSVPIRPTAPSATKSEPEEGEVAVKGRGVRVEDVVKMLTTMTSAERQRHMR